MCYNLPCKCEFVKCKEKEHFEAEDSVVREIGHLNEGLSLSTLKRYVINMLKK